MKANFIIHTTVNSESMSSQFGLQISIYMKIFIIEDLYT